MSKVLALYNTFTRKLNPVKLSGKLVDGSNSCRSEPLRGSLYICGPTVYSDCHLGHALTYIRVDLLRRFLKAFFNVRLETVMNVTDIDDKILEKTRLEFPNELDQFCHDAASHPFHLVGERYFNLFLEDMKSIRVLPADFYVKVSQSIKLITDFIARLEMSNSAYLTDNDLVLFRVRSVENYVGRSDPRKETAQPLSNPTDKSDPKDFVLWKKSKPLEPSWIYTSSTNPGKTISGRPGWHVQCSAIASAMFGNKLDFHYGGKDLIFPHHYNEEACCCAYHSLNTSNSLHVWANHWLHSGHLVFRETKMSKSLGNVVPIKNFINRSSVNALRLVCIASHYRSDLQYTEDLLQEMNSLDHKLSAFVSYLREVMRYAEENLSAHHFPAKSAAGDSEGTDISITIEQTRSDIVEGICNDFDLSKGLSAILNLSKKFYSLDKSQLRPCDMVACWCLLEDWCGACALEYGQLNKSEQVTGGLLEVLNDFRQKVRNWSLDELKAKKSDSNRDVDSLKRLLNECDIVRARMDELGFVIRDKKSS